MNNLTYQLALTHRDDLLRQATEYRRARQLSRTRRARATRSPDPASSKSQRRPAFTAVP